MGQFTISLDFELGWGSIENGIWRRREAAGVYRELRNVLPVFLKALEDHEVSLTWATVGAMIDPPRPSDLGHLPEPIKTATRAFVAGSERETHDGRDLFEMVLNTRTPQDIGSHTFAHCRWSTPGFSVEAKEIEAAQSVAALEKFDVTPNAFVYPLNHYSDLEVLRGAGFQIARTAPRRPSTRLGKLIEMLSGSTPASELSAGPRGLNCETGSMLYVWGIRNDWRVRKILIDRQIRLGLRRAARDEGDFHIWLHPFNLAETPGLLEHSISLISKVARMRDRGEIDIVTMADKAINR